MLFVLPAYAIEFDSVETTKMTNVPGFENCTYNAIAVAGILTSYIKVIKCPNSSTSTTVQNGKVAVSATVISDAVPLPLVK